VAARFGSLYKPETGSSVDVGLRSNTNGGVAKAGILQRK